MAWQDRAACAGKPVEYFDIPDPDSPGIVICQRCPVINECRDWVRSERPNFVGIAAGEVWGKNTRRLCGNCGREFQVAQYGKTRVYCSNKCGNIARYRASRGAA